MCNTLAANISHDVLGTVLGVVVQRAHLTSQHPRTRELRVRERQVTSPRSRSSERQSRL